MQLEIADEVYDRLITELAAELLKQDFKIIYEIPQEEIQD